MKIGVLIPFPESAETGKAPSWAEIRNLAIRAEDAGFDSIWICDHLLYRFPEQPTVGIWECWSMLSALAEATNRAEIGTLVMAAAWRNPALLAKMAVTVDEISGGRLILGLGAGWHQPEFDAFGYPFDHRVSRFEEAMEIITSLLRTGKVDFQGKYFRADDGEMRPRGPRPGGPQVLIASRGERMLDLTARYADQWNTAWFGPAEGIAKSRADLEAACERVGRDPGEIEVTVGVSVFVPLEGYTDDSPEHPDRCLHGTPEQIAAGLRSYAEAGVDHVICAGMADGRAEYTSAVLDTLTAALDVYRRE